MITAALAPVRPRILSGCAGDSQLLEDYVYTTAAARVPRTIQLVGPTGGGKTTALCHLAATVANHLPIVLLDHARLAELNPRCTSHLVVCTCLQPLADCITLTMAPWTDDDCIEYLLARHDRRAHRVFAALRAAPDRALTCGSPELCCVVMDQMAADESLRTVGAALLKAVQAAGQEVGDRELAAKFCESVFQWHAAIREPQDDAPSVPLQTKLWRLLRFPTVRTLVTADSIAQRLRQQQHVAFLTRQLPYEVIRETANRIRTSPIALDYLRGLAQYGHDASPMASSILHATGTQWRPRRPNANLTSAYFERAPWRGIALWQADLRFARLARSDLRGAVLRDLNAQRANFARARLDNAVIQRGHFLQANFSHASLRQLRASDTCFTGCKFAAANLRQAHLSGCRLERADLSGANMYAARLRGARLIDAIVRDTDFRSADFSAANLIGVRLRKARLRGAIFDSAVLRDCDLECISWDQAMFRQADLGGATLCGSVLPGANFRGADLRGAQLGQIVWEHADLKSADLTGCSFQMRPLPSPSAVPSTTTGQFSSESDGLIGASVVPRASLRGSDLTGAKIDGVDFYLVDLRNAVYENHQEIHFRATGAILNASSP